MPENVLGKLTFAVGEDVDEVQCVSILCDLDGDGFKLFERCTRYYPSR